MVIRRRPGRLGATVVVHVLLRGVHLGRCRRLREVLAVLTATAITGPQQERDQEQRRSDTRGKSAGHDGSLTLHQHEVTGGSDTSGR